MSLVFQAIDWRTDHISFEPEKEYPTKEFVVQIFGKTKNNENVFVIVKNFKPGFYILNDDYVKYKTQMIHEDKLSFYNKLTFSKGFLAKEFYGFHGDEKTAFVKVSCNLYYILKKFEKYCQGYQDKKEQKYIGLNIKTFESNKDPILQFMHARNVLSCGWIEIENTLDYDLDDIDQSNNADIAVVVDYKQVKPYQNNKCEEISPFVIGAMDIECISDDNKFPDSRKKTDKIVSIATTFSRVKEEECYRKVVLLIGKCPPLEGIEVICCKNERELILKWCELIIQENPDILTNWNGFGFDDKYIYFRSKLYELGTSIVDKNKIQKDNDGYVYNFTPNLKLSRLIDENTQFVIKKMSSAQMGDNIMKYFDMRGRVNFDLMKFIRREHNLAFYKLDYVAQLFFREQLKEIYNLDEREDKSIIEKIEKIVINPQEYPENSSLLEIKTKEFFKDQYIIIVNNDGVTDYEIENNRKFKILDIIDNMHMIIDFKLKPEILHYKGKIYCCNVKDDVPPKEIFEKYRSGNPKEIGELMRYNVQDCNLCNKIINKLNIMVNNIGMANVCNIPLNWIFNRGQSQRVFSVVSKHCKEKGYKIETYKKTKTDDETEDIESTSKITYEGAIVFHPEPDIYDCIYTLDYASLYPTSMICRNISHETYVEDLSYMEKYKDDYVFFPITYEQLDKEIMLKKKKAQLGLKKKEKNEDKNYNLQKSNLLKWMGIDEQTFDKNKTCYFAYKKNGEQGILPEVLKTLLGQRKRVRKDQALYEAQGEHFKASVCNGLQLAYKIVCNSVYGQLGCSREVGPIAYMDLAACTTATGRYMVLRAKEFAEIIYPSIANTVLGKYDKGIVKNLIKEIEPTLKEGKSQEHKFIKLHNKHIYIESQNTIDTYTKKDPKYYQDKIIVNSAEERYNNMKILMDYYLKYYGKENKLSDNIGININMQDPDKRKALYDKIFETINKNLGDSNYFFHVVYGDTDSIMVAMDLADKKTNQRWKGLEMRQRYITLGLLGSDIINQFLPPPENLEYEKILTPFTILSKKKYVANLYEEDPNKFYQKNMGIVLKRRDNARIVKYVVGGVVDKLINSPDLEQGKKEALEFTDNILKDIIDGKFDINYFIITKSLKEKYKTKTDPSHVALAKKIAKRDPGNAPAANDRIPYVFMVVDNKKAKNQGYRVENPQYLLDHNLQIDYLYYIKKQIENPCKQFLELYNPKQASIIFKNAENYFYRKQAGLNTNVNGIFSFNNSSKKKSMFSMDF